MKSHRVVVRPGDRIEIELVERLENGYDDALASLCVTWQDRDRPSGEIATKQRELQVDVHIGHAQGRVGPVVVTHR